MKLTRWHLHHTLEIDGKLYYRFEGGNWHEKSGSDWREISSLKEAVKLEKIFKEVKVEQKKDG